MKFKVSGIFLIIAVFFFLPSAQNNTASFANDLKWQSIAFGQSVDLNFSSTILPEKVGVNKVTPEFPGTINGKIVIESRG
jgi:pectate disaccharide-lyase